MMKNYIVFSQHPNNFHNAWLTRDWYFCAWPDVLSDKHCATSIEQYLLLLLVLYYGTVLHTGRKTFDPAIRMYYLYNIVFCCRTSILLLACSQLKTARFWESHLHFVLFCSYIKRMNAWIHPSNPTYMEGITGVNLHILWWCNILFSTYCTLLCTMWNSLKKKSIFLLR